MGRDAELRALRCGEEVRAPSCGEKVRAFLCGAEVCARGPAPDFARVRVTCRTGGTPVADGLVERYPSHGRCDHGHQVE